MVEFCPTQGALTIAADRQVRCRLTLRPGPIPSIDEKSREAEFQHKAQTTPWQLAKTLRRKIAVGGHFEALTGAG
jgi:hypothetical protein